VPSALCCSVGLSQSCSVSFAESTDTLIFVFWTLVYRALSMLKDPITSRDMRALELNAEYFGVSRLLLMENAGHNVALEVSSRFKPGKSVVVFCGLGGNGGDGFVAARHLSCMGFKVKVLLAGKSKDILDKAALENWRALQFLDDTIPVEEVYDSALVPKTTSDVVIDALLGTGAKESLRPPVLQLVERINEMDAFRVAVDVPTGIDADTGTVAGEAVKANLTVTFHRSKKGLEKAKKHVGELVVKNIGLPEEFEQFAGPGDVLLIAKPRPSESHKGDFGRLLVIGGNETFSGAPTLVAQAALRTGVDLAYVAAPEKTAYAISSMSPDLITIKLEGKYLNPSNLETLKPYVEASDAIVVGPGLGLHPETGEAVKEIVKTVEKFGKPLLLDADGLKAFARFKRRLDVPLVLTPHAGEYAILTGKKPPGLLSERVLQVQRTAARLNATVLLKGPVDVVSDGKRVKLNFTGNAGMTVGGTGDVLSGVAGAFLAQRADCFEAAVAAAFVNGAAGDFVFEELGAHMVASDLIPHLPNVLNDPMSHLKVLKARAKAN
jgi:ADP-dependent NAD(P)H-hydrate dehydratase / NAD(P)H-hydrate epimerase